MSSFFIVPNYYIYDNAYNYLIMNNKYDNILKIHFKNLKTWNGK